MPSARIRNVDRNAYAAERHLERWFDADQPVRAYGSTWYLEAEVKFGRLEDVQRYVDRVLAHIDSEAPVTVLKGRRNAYYQSGRIWIPETRFGLRETTVLHEMAHHLSPGDHEHGPAFRAAFVRLLEDTGHPVAARLLQIYFHETC